MISLSKKGNSYNKSILQIDGLSTETKPTDFVSETDNNGNLIKKFYITNGSTFTEIDTGKKYLYDEENKEWHESGKGGGGSSEYAHTLELSIDSSTYILTAVLKNIDGDTLGTAQTIDLPLESMVVSGSYDDTTKKIILTLKNGNTVEFSVADLVSGLQTEITSNNKLSADLVDDRSTTNKFVTSAEKTKIANALTEEVYNAGKQVKNGAKTGEIFNDYTDNVASGDNSHAEGYSTTASGDFSHAEGCYATASGSGSHAEGSGNTLASGDCSHAEGYSTTASGYYSHTEGYGTMAGGMLSHAEGWGTIADSANQHVQGTYNIKDSNDKYAFIIGNGNSNTRSNAFAIDWNGLIYVNNSATGVNVSQLQPIINSTNKLSSDMVDDTDPNVNKFVTAAEKTQIATNTQNISDIQTTIGNINTVLEEVL